LLSPVTRTLLVPLAAATEAVAVVVVFVAGVLGGRMEVKGPPLPPNPKTA